MCICTSISMYVLFCHVLYECFVCILYAYMCIYLCICIFVCVYIYVCFTYMYICMCVYICMFICVHICFSLCMCWYKFCLYKSYLFNCFSCIQVATSLFGIAIWVVSQHSLSKFLNPKFEYNHLHKILCSGNKSR